MGFREKKKQLDEVLNDEPKFIHKGKKVEITQIKPDKPKIIKDDPEIIPPLKGEPGYDEWMKRIWG